jgi:hypothetical protein
VEEISEKDPFGKKIGLGQGEFHRAGIFHRDHLLLE